MRGEANWRGEIRGEEGGSMREREGGRKEEDFSLTRVVWVKHHVRAESVKILRRPGNSWAAGEDSDAALRVDTF